MKLFSFLQTLLSEGSVIVEGQLTGFEEDDLVVSRELLKQFYNEDILNMPSSAPAFCPEAAIWAAKHVYLSLQLTVLRDVDEEIVNETLKAFEGETSPSSIYSADLVLRYIPEIFTLAKGLAPADIMVKKIMDTAAVWPYSTVGMTLQQEVDDAIILSHPSLKISYIDRIISAKDSKRLTNVNIKESVAEALGNYASVLWPEFYEQFSNNKSCTLTTQTSL